MLVESLQEFLSTNAGVTNLIGTVSTRTDGTTGIFPMVALGTPDAPYLVCSQVGGEPQTVSMQGTNRLQNARWRFSCHGANYKQSKQLAKFVRLAMDGIGGPAGVLYVAAGKSEFHGAWLRSEVDTGEPIPHGTLFTTHVDYEILFLDYDDA